MRSSTSSFKASRRKYAVCLGVFALSAALSGAASFFLWRYEAGGRNTAAVGIQMPGDDYFLSYFRYPLDHHILYHGLDIAAERNLEHADVLFLGNSRTMFAASEKEFSAFFKSKGLTYYMLGFGFGEADRFATALIRKKDLHPKIVVVNADAFFIDEMSPWAEKVVQQERWEAQKFIFESEATFWFQRFVHKVIPHWSEFSRYQSSFYEALVFRSRENGCWRLSWSGNSSPPVRAFTPNLIVSEVLSKTMTTAALNFKAEMDKRGCLLLLMYVPSPDNNPSEAFGVSQLLKVPLLFQPVDNLATFDSVHLDDNSRRRFAAMILEELGTSKEFQQFCHDRTAPK